MLSFVGLNAELFISITCDCNSKSWYAQYTVNVVIMNSMKIKLLEWRCILLHRLHKWNVPDIKHVAAISMTALKFVPYSCINIDVHNSIKTFCSECLSCYVVTHYADIWRCLQVNLFYKWLHFLFQDTLCNTLYNYNTNYQTAYNTT
jgi:hypothetical protein